MPRHRIIQRRRRRRRCCRGRPTCSATYAGSLSLPGDVMGRSRHLVACVPARLHPCGEGATGGGRARAPPVAAAGGLAGLCGRPRLFGACCSAPVFAAETHGYDTIDHFRIDPRLGDQDDFDQLIAEAGRRGLRVVLDGVFNTSAGRSRHSRPHWPAARFTCRPVVPVRPCGRGVRHVRGPSPARRPESRGARGSRLRGAGHDLLAGPGRGGMAARRRVRGTGQLLGQGATGAQGRPPGRVVPW